MQPSIRLLQHTHAHTYTHTLATSSANCIIFPFSQSHVRHSKDAWMAERKGEKINTNYDGESGTDG